MTAEVDDGSNDDVDALYEEYMTGVEILAGQREASPATVDTERLERVRARLVWHGIPLPLIDSDVDLARRAGPYTPRPYDPTSAAAARQAVETMSPLELAETRAAGETASRELDEHYRTRSPVPPPLS